MAAAVVGALSLLALMPGCRGGAPLAGDATSPGTLVLQLSPADIEPAMTLPRTFDVPWAGAHLIGLEATKAKRIQARLSSPQRDVTGERVSAPFAEGWLQAPAGALRQDTPVGEQPRVIRFRRPSVDVALVEAYDARRRKAAAVDEDAARLRRGMARVTLDRGFVDAALRVESPARRGDILWLALQGLDRPALENFAGLRTDLDLDDLHALNAAGVTARKLAELERLGTVFRPDELRELLASGVTIDDAIAFREAGFPGEVAAMTKLKAAGVGRESAVALDRAGLGGNVDRAAALTEAGIPPRYIDLVSRLGYSRGTDVRRLYEARVEPLMIRRLQRAGLDRAPVDTLIDARGAGVTGEDALAMAEAGYDVSLPELIALKQAGIDRAFIEAVADDQFKPLPADQLIELKRRGLTAEMIRELRASTPLFDVGDTVDGLGG